MVFIQGYTTMNQLQLILKKNWVEFENDILTKGTGCILFVLLVLFSACAGQKMSLEEAKKVTITMGGESFVPPPRRINDVLAILDQPAQFDQTIVRKNKALADQSPPQSADNVDLCVCQENDRLGNILSEIGELTT